MMNAQKTRLFPSLISADLLNLQRELEVLDPIVDGYHIDIMDGHFVPNLTWGNMFVEAIAAYTKKQLWIHLMVDNPLWWIQHLPAPQGSLVSIHIESTTVLSDCINKIKEKKWEVSIAVNPKTAISKTFEFLHVIDQVLIMSVAPGFSGQPFIPSVCKKIQPLQDQLKNGLIGHSMCRIGMDGGVTKENGLFLAKQGVSDFAVASGIFSYPDRPCAVRLIRNVID